MISKRIFLALILTICLSAGNMLMAQNKVGTTAAAFLGISVGPRAQAMGSAYAAMSDDVTSVYWNPAALVKVDRAEFMISHTSYLLDTKFNWVGFNVNMGSGTAMGISLTQLDYGREEITTLQEQEGTGRYWDAQDLAVNISVARALTERFSLGGSFKYISQSIWNESATAVAVDLGILFRTNFNNMRLGMSISNYGTRMRMDGEDLLQQIDIDPEANGNNETLVARLKTEDYPLPIFFRLGVAYDFWNTENNRLTMALDALHPTDNVESVNIGAEYSLYNLVALRGGYKGLFMEDPQEGLTLGGGLKYKLSGFGMLRIDYAYMTFKDLNDIQTFAFSFMF